jgi:peptidoglycan hydrolase-like protein with peptidoglycan-binding domain
MAGQKRKTMSHTSETPADDQAGLPYRHSLDTGDRGALVLWAQSRLTEHGYYDGPLDGRYDLAVSKAVRRLQGAEGLAVTGIIDRKTWAAL